MDNNTDNKYEVNQKESQAFLLILLVGSTLASIFSIFNNNLIDIPIATHWRVTNIGAITILLTNFGLYLLTIFRKGSVFHYINGILLILFGLYSFFYAYKEFNIDSHDYNWIDIILNGEVIYSVVAMFIGFCFITSYQKKSIKYVSLFASFFLIVVGLFSITTHLIVDSHHMHLIGVTWTSSLTSLLYGFAILLTFYFQRPFFLNLPRSAIAAGVLGVVLSVFVWFAGILALYDYKFDVANSIVAARSSEIENKIESKGNLMKRFMARWIVTEGTELLETLKEVDIENYMNDEVSIKYIALFSPEMKPIWQKGNTEETSSWVIRQTSKLKVVTWLNDKQDEQDIRWFFPDVKTSTKALMTVNLYSREEALVSVVDFKNIIEEKRNQVSKDFIVDYSVNNHSLKTIKPKDWDEELELKTYAASNITLDGGQLIQIKVMGGAMMINDAPSIIIQVFSMIGVFITYQLVIGITLVVVGNRQANELKLSEQRFRSLFDQTPDPIYAIGPDGNYKSFNTAIKKILKVEGLVGKHFKNTIKEPECSPDDIQKFEKSFEKALTGIPSEYKLKFFQENSHPKYFEGEMIPIIINKDVTGIFGIAKDVTDRVIAEEWLNLMNRSLEASSNGVLIIDPNKNDWPIIYVNPAFTEITGYLEDDIIGKNPNFLKSEDTEHSNIRKINNAIEKGENLSIVLQMAHHHEGLIWVQLLLAPVKEQNKETTHIVGIINDISELKKQESQLAFQANHDGLTGLPNRTLFNDRLAHDVELIGRYEGSLAVLFIDLDEFKPINDTLGHKVGDKMLISVSERLGKNLRSSDTLARLGGDEFAMILPYLSNKDEAEKVASRLLDSLNKPHRIDGHELHVSASIGIAINNKAVRQPDELLQQADMAMYQAKQQGKNSFKIYTEDLDSKLAERVIMRGELQEAINNKQLSLYYQPQIDKNGNIDGLEALIRWNHPKKGFISPSVFIPLAEETGQIISLSEWVLNQACLDIKTLSEEGILEGRVAINLSPLQFHRPDFTETLGRTLKEKGVSPKNIELELTEGILMKDTKGAIEILQDLDDVGINVSIDDFGTGFSSMSYLRDLPIHKIKIDKSFVQRANEDEKNSAICSSIITLAKELNIKVVSEGVETEEQHQYLLSLGSDVFQGFLFAKPMPVEELKKWTQEKRKKYRRLK